MHGGSNVRGVERPELVEQVATIPLKWVQR
jgi:hypothetical protein